MAFTQLLSGYEEECKTTQLVSARLRSRKLFTNFGRKKTHLQEHRDDFKHLIMCRGERNTANHYSNFSNPVLKRLPRGHLQGQHRVTVFTSISADIWMLQSSRRCAEHFSQPFEQMFWDRKLRHWGMISGTGFPPLAKTDALLRRRTISHLTPNALISMRRSVLQIFHLFFFHFL